MEILNNFFASGAIGLILFRIDRGGQAHPAPDLEMAPMCAFSILQKWAKISKTLTMVSSEPFGNTEQNTLRVTLPVF